MPASFQNHRIERLRPGQIREALAAQPLVFLPLGTYEFHGAHLPIGLDSLTAQRICLEAAHRLGGLVFPPLYYGWGNNGYPWNIMTHDNEALRSLLKLTLNRLQEMGIKTAVFFSGHFQTEHMTLIKDTAAAWRGAGNGMQVGAYSVLDAPDPPIAPDHAALFETSLLAAFEPGLVDLDQLPDMAQQPANDPDGDPWGAHRGDPAHPLYGIFGADPRAYNAQAGRELADFLITWFTEEVRSIQKEMI